MQAHFVDNKLRIGLSHRNVKRLMNHFRDKGSVHGYPVMACGDIFRDGEQIAGYLQVAISDQASDVIINGSNVFLNFNAILLDSIVNLIADHASFEEVITENITLYIEPDEMHYLHREAGMPYVDLR